MASYDSLEKHIRDKSMRKKFHHLPTHKKKELVHKMSHRQHKESKLKIWFWILCIVILIYFFYRSYSF